MEKYQELYKYAKNIMNLYNKMYKYLKDNKEVNKELIEQLKLVKEYEDKAYQKLSDKELDEMLEYLDVEYDPTFITASTIIFDKEYFINSRIINNLHYQELKNEYNFEENYIKGIIINNVYEEQFNPFINKEQTIFDALVNYSDLLKDNQDINDMKILTSYISLLNIAYLYRLLDDPNIEYKHKMYIIRNISYNDKLLENYLLANDFKLDKEEMKDTIDTILSFYNNKVCYKKISTCYYEEPVEELLKNIYFTDLSEKELYIYTDIVISYFSLLDDNVFDTLCKNIKKYDMQMEENYNSAYFVEEIKNLELSKKLK